MLLLTAPAALLFGQIGFLAHDATHNQILNTSRANYVLSVLLFNLGLGGSRGWWAERHNTHHAQPEPPRVSIPTSRAGWSRSAAPRPAEAKGFVRFMIRNQRGTIAPLLSLSALQIRAYSALFIKARALRNPRAELGLFAIHYVVYLTALIQVMGVGGGLLFAAVHQLLLGLYLGGAFLPNHFGMTVLMPGDQVEFLPRQVITSRNIRGGRVTDYLFGPLGSQIEHHLFPAMPRHNLRAAAPIVRRVCQEQGIVYRGDVGVGGVSPGLPPPPRGGPSGRWRRSSSSRLSGSRSAATVFGPGGRGDWIRTSDPLLPKQVRYRAAPRPDATRA